MLETKIFKNKKKITKFRTLWRLIFCYLKYGKPKVVQIWNFRKLKLTRIKYLGIMAQVWILNSFCFTFIKMTENFIHYLLGWMSIYHRSGIFLFALHSPPKYFKFWNTLDFKFCDYWFSGCTKQRRKFSGYVSVWLPSSWWELRILKSLRRLLLSSCCFANSHTPYHISRGPWARPLLCLQFPAPLSLIHLPSSNHVHLSAFSKCTFSYHYILSKLLLDSISFSSLR